jgi:hypothetical protein
VFSASSPFCAHAFNPDTKPICGVTIKDIALERQEKPFVRIGEFTLKTDDLVVSGTF